MFALVFNQRRSSHNNHFFVMFFQGQFYTGDDIWGSSYTAAAAAAAAAAASVSAVPPTSNGPNNPAQPNLAVPVSHNNNAYYLPVRNLNVETTIEACPKRLRLLSILYT